MKIIHCADLHLDSRLKGLEHNKALRRRLELIESFRSLVKQASENTVSAIIIAGDLFDNHYVSARTKDDVAEIFSSAPEIHFYVLAGNHDASAFDEAYLKRMPKNVHIFGNGAEKFEQEEVVFVGIEGEKLTPRLISGLDFDASRFNILITHADLAVKSAYGGLDLRLLENKPVDYVALGHIHRPYLTDAGRGHAAYSGCLECRGFDEPGEHGFYLLKTHYNDQNRITFMPFSTRVCYEVSMDISGLDNRAALVSAVEKTLSGIRCEDMVSLTLLGESAEGSDPELPVRRFLEDKFFAARLKNETRIRFDATAYAGDVSLKAEFIRKVFAYDCDEDTKRRVIRYGLNALTGEEIDTL